ncbi:MAG: YdcF family protein [Eubacteriales bacterium]|nr:YdcF family protein [Eubacteriales bacterium]
MKRNLIVFIAIIVIYTLLQISGSIVNGNEFKDYLFQYDSNETYNAYDPEDIKIEFDKEGIVSLEQISKEDGWIKYSLHPEHRGSVFMSVYDKKTGEQIYETDLIVSVTGIITDRSTGNFTNYRMYHFNMVLLCIAFSVLLWFSFLYSHKKLRYSYQSIFYSGLALWMTLITILQIRVWLMEEQMIDVYYSIQSAAQTFMLCSLPFLLVFSIALSISNIELIRHEGFRSRNALGIILSIIMIFGAVFSFFIDGFFNSSSEMQVNIFSAVKSVYYSIYVILECFLLGSVICGSLAARHEPEYDMDYLIILGCKIKADGSLYPLIRGRVDRAIAFYHKQLEKTGKRAVFLPSGGQGSDEIISEAAAMKRYLMEQGFTEDQILVEDQSKNTLQNMRFSKKLIEERNLKAKAAFSTTNFHVFRSGIISRQNDFEPDGMGAPTKWYFWPNAYMREVIGMMAFKWKAIVIVMIPIILFFISIQFVI